MADRTWHLHPCNFDLPIYVIKLERENGDTNADISEETRKLLEDFCKGKITSVRRADGEMVPVSLKLVALDFQDSGIQPPCSANHFRLPCIFIVAIARNSLRLMHACSCLYQCRFSKSCRPREVNRNWNPQGKIQLDLAKRAILSSDWNADHLKSAVRLLESKHACFQQTEKGLESSLLEYSEVDHLLTCTCNRRKEEKYEFFVNEAFSEVQPSSEIEDDREKPPASSKKKAKKVTPEGAASSSKSSKVTHDVEDSSEKTTGSSKKKAKLTREGSAPPSEESKVAPDLASSSASLPLIWIDDSELVTITSAQTVRHDPIAFSSSSVPSIQAECIFEETEWVESAASVTARTGTVSTTNQMIEDSASLITPRVPRDWKVPTMLSPKGQADLVARTKKLRNLLAMTKNRMGENEDENAMATMEDTPEQQGSNAMNSESLAKECKTKLTLLAEQPWMQVMGQGGGMHYVRTTAILKDEGGANDPKIGGSNLQVFLSLLLFTHCRHESMQPACTEWNQLQLQNDRYASANRGQFLLQYGFPLPSRYRRLVIRFTYTFDEDAQRTFGLQINQNDMQHFQSLDVLRGEIQRAEAAPANPDNPVTDIIEVDFNEELEPRADDEAEVDYTIVIPGWLAFEFVSYGNQAAPELAEDAVRQAHYVFQLRSPNSVFRDLNPDPLLRAAVIILNQTSEGTEQELELAKSTLRDEMQDAAKRKSESNRLNGTRFWNSLSWLETNLEIFSFDVHSSLGRTLTQPDHLEGDLLRIDNLLHRVASRVVDNDAPIFIIAEDLLQGAVSLLELDHENDSRFIRILSDARRQAILDAVHRYREVLDHLSRQQSEVSEWEYQMARVESIEEYRNSLLSSLKGAGYNIDQTNSLYIQPGVEDLNAINQGIGRRRSQSDEFTEGIVPGIVSESQDDRWEEKWNACQMLLSLMQLLWPEHF